MSAPGRKPAVRVALAFLASAVGSVLFAVTYLSHGSTQVLGATAAVALGGLGAGLAMWSKTLMPQGPWEEDRPHVASSEQGQREAAATFTAGEHSVPRRRLLGGLLAGAGGLAGLAALLPVRSLGPSPQVLEGTGWGPGVRLVDADGQPISLDQLPIGGMVTAFPEGGAQQADSQVVLVRVDEAATLAAPERAEWVVAGNLAYSRVCTHAGCAVGMFQPDAHLLVCPCHQAAFNVVQAGRSVFGPAPRPLPQLPLDVDAEGMLVARSDFHEPVGPDRWRID